MLISSAAFPAAKRQGYHEVPIRPTLGWLAEEWDKFKMNNFIDYPYEMEYLKYYNEYEYRWGMFLQHLMKMFHETYPESLRDIIVPS